MSIDGPGAVRTRAVWSLYEMFVGGKHELNHGHVGSLRAPDDAMVLVHARVLYTLRNEGVSVWAARSGAVAASKPAEKNPFLAPSGDKIYPHSIFYDIPYDIPHH
ncbi:1,2-phenylacetyl-CoA epoxidase subunit PaaB [Streptomyces chartreusis]